MRNQLPKRLEAELPLAKVVDYLSAGCCMFILFSVYTMHFNDLVSLSVYLTFLLAVTFILLAHEDKATKKNVRVFLDCLYIILSIIVGLYSAINANAILARAGSPTEIETALGLVTIFLVLEATRRFVGIPLVILSLVLLVYTFFGRYFPSVFIHPGFSFDRISAQMYSSLQGIFGLPMKVMFKYVALFIIFGSLLEMAGGIDFFMNLAMAVSGRFKGGLAKIAVLSSALMGSISGSAVANVATTGSFTIPSMIKKGYDPKFAAAVESLASTGGQLMPPVMGAAAFLMADFLNIGYFSVCIAALFPAILYFTTVFLTIHFYASKSNLMGEDKKSLPKVGEVLTKQGFLLLPIIVIVVVLAMGYSPIKAVYCAIVTVIAVSYLSKNKKFHITPVRFLEALVKAGRSGLMVGLASACAGIILGTFLLTGLGTKVSSTLITLSGGNLLVLLILSMVASIIFGMGVTTTVCYIILATLVAPALIQLGVIPIVGPLFIFYFGMLSMLTPPVAMAVYTASAIANTEPNKTGFLTWKMALPIFSIPYFFIYEPGLALIGNPLSIMWTLLTSLIGISSISAGLVGYIKSPLSPYYRVLLMAGGFCLVHGSILTDSIGFILLAVVVLVYVVRSRRVATRRAIEIGRVR